MKGLLFLTVFSICTQLLNAQFFVEDTSNSFANMFSQYHAFADVDGDGDEDVLMIGSIGNDDVIHLFFNDGQGQFSVGALSLFEPVRAAGMAFSDVDGDDDPDVLITGFGDWSNTHIAKLYLNDGTGVFTEQSDTPFEGLQLASISFSDIDSDNDQDVLLTGRTNDSEPSTTLYINDGQGNFTEVTDDPFLDVDQAASVFVDVDGDEAEDLLIAGQNFGDQATKLYLNDGEGNFTEAIGAAFEGVEESAIAFADIDGDSDQDVLIAGVSWVSFGRISKLYTNDGQGSFTEVLDTPFEGIASGSVAFSDVDGDNDPDVIIAGVGTMDNPTTSLYLNDGQGVFTEVPDIAIEDLIPGDGHMALADIDGDDDEDVLISGLDESFDRVMKLYLNQGPVSVSSINATPFDIRLHPNPVNGEQIFLHCTIQETEPFTVNILDLQGQVISQHQQKLNLGVNAMPIDLTSLSNGEYFIQLDNGKRKAVASFIIQR